MLKALRDLRQIWDSGEWRPEGGAWFPTPGLVVLPEEKTARRSRKELFGILANS